MVPGTGPQAPRSDSALRPTCLELSCQGLCAWQRESFLEAPRAPEKEQGPHVSSRPSPEVVDWRDWSLQELRKPAR